MWKRWSSKPLPAKDPSRGEDAPSLSTQTIASNVQIPDSDRVESTTVATPTAVAVPDGPGKEDPATSSSDVRQPAAQSTGSSPQPHGPAPLTKAGGAPNVAVSSAKSHEGRDAVDDNATSNTLPVPLQDQPVPPSRRLSFRSLAIFHIRNEQPLSSSPVSPSVPATSKTPVATDVRLSSKPKLSRSERQALSSALTLRTLIIGPGSPRPPSADSVAYKPKKKHAQGKLVHPHSSPDLEKVKSRLLSAKTANAVIAQLRRLPLPGSSSILKSSQSHVTQPDAEGAPIHAVCLACTDEEADRTYFSRLRTGNSPSSPPFPSDNILLATTSSGPLGVGTASLESLVSVLRDLHLVSLLESPDLGFGKPVSEVDTGPLTGSVPSAGAIITGFEEVTRQLMSLGFATSKAVFPSHANVYPPEDRMSVLTYWWGLELVLPEPSVKYLANVESISHAVLNFLSAVSLINNGVREVLPFIRYISNFVDFEWGAIQAQDKGQGVVCAATWVMPAAMVPRPWDFPPRPTDLKSPATMTVSPKPAPVLSPVSNNHAGGGKERVPKTEASSPAFTPGVPYPPAATVVPALKITPATLPRGVDPPQSQEVAPRAP